MHVSFEDDENILKKGIKDLMGKKSGKSFKVEITAKMAMSTTYLQFYNWPSIVMNQILRSTSLVGKCSKIEPFEFKASRS